MSYHIPVLKEELLALVHKYVDPKEEGSLFADATIGDAGHSLALLKSFPKAVLLGFDRDGEMLARARSRLYQSKISLFPEELEVNETSAEYHLKNFFTPLNSPKKEEPRTVPKVALCHASYHHLASFLKKQGLEPKLILLDLGVSLFHLKESGRGFSYLDQNLDMRFESSKGLSAKEIINHSSSRELSRIFRDFGEEPFAHRLAGMIVKKRPFASACDLAESIRKSLKNKGRTQRIHPATRSFQALRIAVNQELDILQTALKELPHQLAPGGLLAVIAFHSLEDRIVKLAFREVGVLEQKKAAQDAPFLILNRRPLRPSAEEVYENPASRSARLRVLFAQRGT